MKSTKYRTALGALFLGAIAVGQDRGARELRVFDVGAIVGEVASAHLAPSATPLQSSLIPGDAARVRLTGGGEPSRAIDVDFLAQLVNEAAEGAVDVAAEGSRLWVRGDAAAHAKVSALLAAARAACGDAVVVRLALVDGTPPKAVLNAVETAAFLSQNPPRFEVAATGATDFPFAIRSGRDISFVGDYDVEVAQKSGVSDPGIRVLPVGVSAVVGALASPDGRLLLRLAGTYTTADVRPRTASAGEASKFGDLETPEATSVAVAGSAAIENGGCFVVGAAAAGGFWIATASRVRPYPESAEAGFVPCAALVRSSFDLGPMGVDADFFSGAGPGPIGEGRDEPTSLIVDDRLMALVKEGAPSEENGAGVSMTQGGRLALRGPESYRKAVRSAASKLAAGLLRNAQAEIRFGVVGAPEAAGLMGGGKPEALLQGRMVVAALSGEPFRVVAGTERAFVMDADVEIAQESIMMDPVVRSVFEGVACEGALELDENGAVSLSAKFFRSADAAPQPGPRMPEGVAINVVRPERTRLTARATLSDDAWRPLGATSVKGGVFVVMARSLR